MFWAHTEALGYSIQDSPSAKRAPVLLRFGNCVNGGVMTILNAQIAHSAPRGD